jgi:RND family efflux transporter MFP subunit
MSALPLRLAVLATAIGLAGCSAPVTPPARPRPVRTMVVGAQDDRQVVIQAGDIQPRLETELGFRLDGRVVARPVEVGAIVRRGDLLATLDTGDAQLQVRQAQADLDGAEATLDLARVSMGRQQTLYDKGLVAPARLQEAQSSLKAELAKRDRANAALASARDRAGYTRLTAPADGVVTAVGANAGQVVTAGQMVVKLASQNQRDAVFDVAERLLNSGLRAPSIVVTLASDPAVGVVGPVRQVSPTADAATGTYRVRVDISSAPKAMILGATVIGRLEGPADRLVALPSSVVTSQDGRPAVYVVEAGQTLRRRPVSVARYAQDQVLIADGLKAGDRVVTAGVSQLRPGQAVRLEDDAR